MGGGAGDNESSFVIGLSGGVMVLEAFFASFVVLVIDAMVFVWGISLLLRDASCLEGCCTIPVRNTGVAMGRKGATAEEETEYDERTVTNGVLAVWRGGGVHFCSLLLLCLLRGGVEKL